MTAQTAASPVVAKASPRVVSIDIFRGLTMAAMIFVNALADVPGLPWWTYHAHANQDLMTYVDMVYPFFLFIVGMSLPISVAERLKRNPSQVSLWLHVMLRSASLIGLGLILANAEKADASRMGFNGSIWALLALLSAALYLNVYPVSERFPVYDKILRIVGLTGVVVLYAVFRQTISSGQAAHAGWIDPSYPEILGLIGLTYFAVALLYIPTRRWNWASPVWLALLTVFCAFSTAKLIPLPGKLRWYFWPFDNGAMASIVMAGVVISGIFLRANPASDARKLRPSSGRAMTIAAVFGVAMLVAGWLITPLGISKIRATPTWSLYSSGAATLLFTLLYWVCDVRKTTAWAALVRPAGSNALLTYLLPDLWYFLFSALGITYLDTHWNLGWLAVVKTIIFTLLMLALAAALTKAKVRLQL